MPSYFVHPVSRQAIATKNLAAGVVGQLCLLNALNLVASTAPTTVLLPPAAGDGECVYVEDLSDLAGTNNITIDGNGDTIDGAATLLLDSNGEVAALVFDDGEWKRVTPVRLFESSANPVPFSRTTDIAGAVGVAWPLIAPDGQYIQFGTTQPATAGTQRFRNVASALVRRADNLANLVLFETTAGNNLYLGSDSSQTQAFGNINIYAAGGSVFIGQNGGTRLVAGSAEIISWNGDPFIFGHAGLSPAAGGDIRGRANRIFIAIRAASGAGDLNAMSTDGSDNLILGGSPAGALGALNNIFYYAAANHFMAVGANSVLVAAATAIQSAQPIIGYDGASSPFGVHGKVGVALADANYTPVAAEYRYTKVRFTGALTALRTITWPAPSSAARSYFKYVDNATGQILRQSTGAGTTIDVAAGTREWISIEDTGVTLASPVF